MAQRLVTVDDIDGTAGASPQFFSLGKDAWEIDLTDENAEKLRDALAPFIEHARKVSKGRAPSKRASRAAGPNKAIREWAEAHGHAVPSRGRIPQKVVDAYNAR